MIEIRGQQATDWEDVYRIRAATAGALPYIRPDWVKDELAQPEDGTWPMVAVARTPDGERVVARTELRLGRGRRAHCAWPTLEWHPASGKEAAHRLLQKAVEVAEKWWNRRRLEVELPSTDKAAIALFESFDFAQEARLRQSVRIAGELVDDLVLARLSGDAARPVDPVASPPTGALDPSGAQPRTAPSGRAAKSGTRTESTLPMGSRLRVRGGSSDDWEALHTIWAQPTVYWGTMQIPYPSADRSRERIQDRAPPRFWPLMAEVDGTVVGSTGLHRGDHNRSHVGHIGMMVHTDYQGMGVGTALLAAVIDLGENWLGLSRIQLEVYTDNTRAIRLYERHGFEEEGSLRAHSYRDGRYVDVLVMGRTRDG